MRQENQIETIAWRRSLELGEISILSILAGALLGVIVGFLLRPSADIVGQLSLNTVLLRGTNLKGLDQALIPLAERSFNMVLAATIVGAVAGFLAAPRFAGRRNIKNIGDLLDRGFDINAKNLNGETALMSATFRGKADLVELLLDRGAEVNARNGYGATALMYAAEWGYSRIAKTLLESGADVNLQDNGGETALSLALHRNNTEVTKLLKGTGIKE